MSHNRPPTVSVVIPAFNATTCIEKRWVLSMRRGTRIMRSWWWTMGRPNHTRLVVEEYFQRRGMPGRCVRQENKKIAGARNTGMRSARGTYIALLDHDDLWYPGKLGAVMQEFELHPEVDRICHNENIVRNGQFQRLSRNGPAVSRMYERLLLSGNVLSLSATVFRRDKALSIGGFRESPPSTPPKSMISGCG